MAGETYAALWDKGADVPAWFAAGLAALSPARRLAALGLQSAPLNDGAMLPAETLAIDPPDDAPLNERALWEAQARCSCAIRTGTARMRHSRSRGRWPRGS